MRGTAGGSGAPGESGAAGVSGRPGESGAGLAVEARCKVNLGLAVLARRGDGYHQIETVMARLALADDVELELLPPAADDERPVHLTVVPDEEVSAQHPELARSLAATPAGADNLVVRAAEAYLAEWSRLSGQQSPRIAVKLVKRVPVAAGLGGGSSDAAATLRGLAKLLPGAGDVAALAARLGSDVPFFVADLPAAVAKGRGERLTPVAVPGAHLVLAKPPLAVSAAEGYAALLGFTPRLRPERALEALARGEEPGWRNALQAGVSREHPVVREVLGALRTAGLRGCIMSGSGPTCFGVATDSAAAEQVAGELAAARPGLWVHATSFG